MTGQAAKRPGEKLLVAWPSKWENFGLSVGCPSGGSKVLGTQDCPLDVPKAKVQATNGAGPRPSDFLHLSDGPPG